MKPMPIEEAILKEVDRLYKEVIDLTIYEPSKEDKEKRIMEILQINNRGNMLINFPTNKWRIKSFYRLY